MNNLPLQASPGPRMLLSVFLKVVLGITIICLFNPLIPILPSSIPLDPSWVIGLNQAVAQKIPFGDGLIFTFGPYASIYTKAFHPATNQLEIFGSIYLAVLYIVALFKVLRKTRALTIIGLWIVFAGFTTHFDALFYSYALLVGIYCWQILKPVHTPSLSSDLWELITIALLFSGFGLYPLIKGPYFVVYFPIALLAMLAFAREQKWFEMLLIPISIGISIFCFWLFADQDPSNLLGYFHGLTLLIGGFSQAMSTNGDLWEVIGYLIASGSIITYLLLKGGLHYRNLYLCLIFGLFLMAAFKAGFVRHDGHALMSSGCLIIAALLATVIYPIRSAYLLLIFCCAVFLKIEADYKPHLVDNIFERTRVTYQSTWQGLQLRIFQPLETNQQFDRALRSLASSRVLPLLPGTVDIYPFDQTYLIASGNAWNPRPVFQSYHAYTKTLAEKNAQFLKSERSPEYLFFRIESIDERIPSGDDGASWPSLLVNYQPNGFAGQYLILKKNSKQSTINMIPLSRASYQIGDWVNLPEKNAKLFASIDLELSWRGKIKNLLYKSSSLLINLRLQDNSIKHFRLIPGNAQSTFLLSPFIEDAQEFSLLYNRMDALNKNRVTAFSISVDGNIKDWNEDYQISLETIQ